MKNTKLFLFLIFIVPVISYAQVQTDKTQSDKFTIVFDSGLLIGHSEAYYPAPFSANISFMRNIDNRLWIGGGSGAEVIGKTFIPFYADARVEPFASKPFFIYEKVGWTVCANKNYSDGTENQNYYNTYPHPLNENIETKGGFMNELGIGVVMRKSDWSTSLSIGYRYQKTSDSIENSTKIYENIFNRLAFRVGFWF
ncbi:MAG: hypothetical protein ACERKD_12955 [Prolixibacteraceae bacterium]